MSETVYVPQDPIGVEIDLVTCDCGEELTFTAKVGNCDEIDICVDEHICKQQEED